MTMAMISPSRREVSSAEQLRRSPRLVPSRFHLLAVDSRPESLLMIFFVNERLHIAEDGHRRATRGPTRQGARPPPSWLVSGRPLVLLALSISYIL